VTEVGATITTQDFLAVHAQGKIILDFDIGFGFGLPKAGPTGAGVKFGG